MRVVEPKKSPLKKTASKPPRKHGVLLFFVGLIIALGAAGVLLVHTSTGSDTGQGTSPSFNKQQYSVNDPNSIWAVVNKGRILPSSYVPPDLMAPHVPLRLNASNPEMQLRSVAASALQQMFAAADAQHIHLMLSSGYRSYDEQVGVYGGYVSSDGQQSADSSSARPGHSEHQLGLSADVEPATRNCEVEVCFAETSEGKWLAANSYKYGFIIRYQKGQENLTGYEFEPWHVRYVGSDAAGQIHKTNQTLEQFFGLPGYSDYIVNPYQLAAGK